jgi:hypothetical protein
MKEGEMQEKEHNGHTYYLFAHHMAWTMHSSKDCCLGKEHKDNEVANLATFAAMAGTIVSPSY